MKNIAIFGSTGSVGNSTIKVIEQNPELYNIVTLVAKSSIEKLIEQIEKFNPKNVYIESKENADILKEKFKSLNVYYGEKGLEDISSVQDFDIAVSALVGIAGLKPTYNLIKAGKVIALANKEVIVTGGDLIINFAKECNTQLLSIDSEHSAIMQCLKGEENNKIDKILLTASGGPFFDKEITPDITVEEALNHPTWNMGKKISIDSATMMNKGFEIIEACKLFNVLPSQVEVVVHRKSLVHSMVQFEDGIIIAHIGPNSMLLPISYALNYPNRIKNNVEKLDIFKVKSLEFLKPDLKKFKCLKLAKDSMELGHSHQVVLNAVNEVCVEAFLNRKIRFIDISNTIEEILNKHKKIKLEKLESIMQLDKSTKDKTKKYLKI